MSIIAVLVTASMLAACGASVQDETPTLPGTVEDTGLGTSEAATATAVQTRDVPEASGAEEEAAQEEPPAPAGEMTLWPLEADLFYLTDAGQIWRQPLLGDEAAATPVTQLDVQIRDFAVAPGGEWLLYRTDEYVAVSAVNGQSGQLIDDVIPMPAPGWPSQTMAWSPDASKLAYMSATGFEVYIPGAGSEFGPLVYPITEQPINELAWSHTGQWLLVWRQDGTASIYESKPDVTLWVDIGTINGYTWLRDGRLAFAPVDGGLALLDPSNLDSRVFIVPQDRQVTLPAQRPDGTLAFFLHPTSVDDPGTLHLGNAGDMSFRQESGFQVYTRGWAWNPVATRLISKEAGGGPTINLLDPATGSTASFDAGGVPVVLDWGDPPPQGIAGLPLPNDLYFLAPEAGILQVWRLPKNGNPPQPVTSASGDVLDYDISPDGTQIVFTSSGAIYRQVLGTVDVNLVVALNTEGAQGPVFGAPEFSPTGRQIAYANGGIWIMELDSGESRRLIADNRPTDPTREREVIVYTEPQWSPDAQWMLVRAQYYEGYDHALVSVAGTPPEPIPLNKFVSNAEWAGINLALVFSGGGAYSQPHLSLVQPGQPPNISQILDLPIVDAEMRTDGRIAMLRIPSPYGIGPTSVRLYSALPSGTDLQAESVAFVIDQARMAPDGTMIAGLVQARYGEGGMFAGRLAIANPSTGEIFVIEGVGSVRDLQWGQ